MLQLREDSNDLLALNLSDGVLKSSHDDSPVVSVINTIGSTEVKESLGLLVGDKRLFGLLQQFDNVKSELV